MDDILSRMERVQVEGPTAVAFDADGTLWSGDVGEDTLLGAVARRALRTPAADALSALASRFALPLNDDPNEQARLLFQAFRDGQLPEVEACEMMAWTFAGWARDELKELVREILDTAKLESRRFEPLRRAVEWAREREIRTVVISASPDFVVEVAAASLGFAPEDIAACRPKRQGNTLLAELDAPLPYAEQKVTALESVAPKHHLLAAFGDNSFDLPMLLAATVGVAVRPKPALRALLQAESGVFVLED